MGLFLTLLMNYEQLQNIVIMGEGWVTCIMNNEFLFMCLRSQKPFRIIYLFIYLSIYLFIKAPIEMVQSLTAQAHQGISKLNAESIAFLTTNKSRQHLFLFIYFYFFHRKLYIAI